MAILVCLPKTEGMLPPYGPTTEANCAQCGCVVWVSTSGQEMIDGGIETYCPDCVGTTLADVDGDDIEVIVKSSTIEEVAEALDISYDEAKQRIERKIDVLKDQHRR